jgi:hypothetical protein
MPEPARRALVELGRGRQRTDRRLSAPEGRDRLRDHVPSWLECSAVGGEAGYVIAADAVLKTLVEAEHRGRSALNPTELAHELRR